MSITEMDEIKFTETKDDFSLKDVTPITEENKQYIIAKIYEHFGRPNNVIQQELHLYKGWNSGD